MILRECCRPCLIWAGQALIYVQAHTGPCVHPLSASTHSNCSLCASFSQHCPHMFVSQSRASAQATVKKETDGPGHQRSLAVPSHTNTHKPRTNTWQLTRSSHSHALKMPPATQLSTINSPHHATMHAPTFVLWSNMPCRASSNPSCHPTKRSATNSSP